MPVIEISSLSHPGVEIFCTLTETQLRNHSDSDKSIFIIESPKGHHKSTGCRHTPLAILCEYKHIAGDAADIIERFGNIPIYTGSRKLLAKLTGYILTRGVLCTMRHPTPQSMEEICRKARRIVVINGLEIIK